MEIYHKKNIINIMTDNINKIHILIAEDDRMIQKLFSSILSAPSYDVDFADNGEIVLDKIKAKKYDIIFMDLIMPILDGLETTEIIRKDGNSIPIIGLSGYSDRDEIKLCLHSGMNDFMIKPVNKNDIISMINNYSPKTESDTNFIDIAFTDKNKDKFSFMKKMTDDMKIELLENFIKYIPEQVDLISRLMKEKKYENLSVTSHKFKGSFFNLGTEKLTSILKRIELDAKDRKESDYEGILKELKEELDRIVSGFIEYLNQLKK